MTRPKVTDIKQGEGYSAIVNFGVHQSLLLTPHLVWYSRRRQWNEPWWRQYQQARVIGIVEMKLIVGGEIVIEMHSDPVHRIVKLASGYRQSHLASAWESARSYVESFEGTYPYAHLADIVLAESGLLLLLRRNRLPLATGARTSRPGRRIAGNFPGRIGGLYPDSNSSSGA